MAEIRELLAVKCKRCDAQFRSPIQVDRSSWPTTNVAASELQCPAGHLETYDKADFFFTLGIA